MLASTNCHRAISNEPTPPLRKHNRSLTTPEAARILEFAADQSLAAVVFQYAPVRLGSSFVEKIHIAFYETVHFVAPGPDCSYLLLGDIDDVSSQHLFSIHHKNQLPLSYGKNEVRSTKTARQEQ